MLAGSSSASSPGFNGSAGSSFAGSTTPRTSWALFNSPASLSSSGDFEIGSNLTGVAFMFTRLGEKNLATLHELVPKAKVVGALVNPNNPNAEPQARDLQAAARALGLKLIILAVGNDRDIDDIFSTARKRQAEALLVTADGLFFGLPDKLATLAARHALPTFYPLSDYARAGGLISYGANLSESWRQAGIYVGKIVKGTKVTDLPIIQPTKFELVINMKAAKALDLDVPPSLQQLADEVIE